MPEKINVRGVGVDNISLAEAALKCEEFINGDKFRAVFTPNSEIIQSCIENPELLPLINSADLITPDGIGVVYASRILGTPLKCKTAGYDLGLEVARLSNEKGYRLFLLGGKPAGDCFASIAEQARDSLLAKFPNAQIVGFQHGYFKKEGAENDAVIDEINAASPEVLYVCFGVPAQEKWINANRDRLKTVRLCLALGGSLDGYSGNVKRAPDIFVKLGLEWFYRLCREPKRIGRMMKLPKFLFGTVLFKFRRKTPKK